MDYPDLCHKTVLKWNYAYEDILARVSIATNEHDDQKASWKGKGVCLSARPPWPYFPKES